MGGVTWQTREWLGRGTLGSSESLRREDWPGAGEVEGTGLGKRGKLQSLGLWRAVWENCMVPKWAVCIPLLGEPEPSEGAQGVLKLSLPRLGSPVHT